MRAGRIDRLAAAVADDQAAVEGELVALGVAAEIVVVVEDEDAGGGPGGAAIEPGGRQPADAAADHDQIVAFLDRRAVERKALAVARLRVRGLERAGVLAAQAGERRRIAQGCAAICAAGVRPAAMVSAAPLRKSRREIEDMRADFGSNPARPASRAG